MSEIKQPTDHKKKAGTEDNYTFTYNDKQYTFEKGFDVIGSPKFLRSNRRRDELDFAFTMLEEIAGDEVLAVIDEMSTEEFKEFSKAMGEASRVALSED